ncbi:hypothetical protein C4544_04735 [candidate division WS5 bacterium]|uniref:RCC1-like domain-containing protein n=1 Tax=candidate division WS5 bacterium TaxID=2093353 RepID=A0A419DBU5_9BACT|nr:MAG: hypothetical protein C4544_04735 [candidate division WS5 bacterium]
MSRFLRKHLINKTFIYFIVFILKAIVVPESSWSYLTAPEIGTGWDHSFVRKSDGTLWAWGFNSAGQLGDGTSVNRYSPVQVGADSNWDFVSGGYGWTVALKSDGTLWAWGRNGQGQLGDGTTVRRFSPVQIGTDNTWVSVKAGNAANLALKSDGTLWAWGHNGGGQLGYIPTETCPTPSGGQPCSTSPRQVGTDTDWVSIVAGGYYSAALKSNGTLWTWGSGDDGQLGLGDRTNRYSPEQVGTDTDWISITAGEYHTLALKANGTLWAFGNNWYGQLGVTSTETCGSPDNPCSTVPVQVGVDSDWAVLAASGFTTLALKSDGTLWGWGRNSAGQFGDGTNINSSFPVQTGTETDWLTVSGGGNHTLALKTDGTLWVWGIDDYGQLGFATTETCTTPYVTFYCSKSPVQLLDAGCIYQIRIAGVSPLYYFSLQTAYDTAMGGAVIQTLDAVFSENLDINRNITATIEGGYDCDFSNDTENTIINGNIMISGGSVTIKNVILE